MLPIKPLVCTTLASVAAVPVQTPEEAAWVAEHGRSYWPAAPQPFRRLPNFQNWLAQREPLDDTCQHGFSTYDPNIVWVGRFCDRTPDQGSRDIFDVCSKESGIRGTMFWDPWTLRDTPHETISWDIVMLGGAAEPSLFREPGGMATDRIPAIAREPMPLRGRKDLRCSINYNCLQLLRKSNNDPHVLCVRNEEQDTDLARLVELGLNDFFRLPNGINGMLSLSTQQVTDNFHLIDKNPPAMGSSPWPRSRAHDHLKLPLTIEASIEEASLLAVLVDDRHRMLGPEWPIVPTVNGELLPDARHFCHRTGSLYDDEAQTACDLAVSARDYKAEDVIEFQFALDLADLAKQGIEHVNLLYAVAAKA